MDNSIIDALEANGIKMVSQEDVLASQSGQPAQNNNDGDQGGQDGSQVGGQDGGQDGGQAALQNSSGDQNGSQDTGSTDNGSDNDRIVYTPADNTDAGQQAASEDEPSEEEVRSFVNEYLQGTLGMTLEQISTSGQPTVDETLKPIIEFVNKTGRSPEEWFIFQQMDPSKMDDVTVLKMELMRDFPDLSPQDVQLMVESKYKVGDEMVEERERKLLDLQMKMDSQKARKAISELRDGYQIPKKNDQAQTQQRIVNDTFLAEATAEIESLEGIDFEIGGKTFTFGLNNSTKSLLKQKTAQVDDYMKQYQTSDGKFNYELFSVHQTVLSNIDEIVKAIYNQGISDGQRAVVKNAGNVGASTPASGARQQTVSQLEEQISQIIGNNSGMMTIKI